MISVGIIGGSGYTGKKLVQFCNAHPYVDDYTVYGHSSVGQSLNDLFPELKGIIVNSIVENSEKISEKHDVYFIALPHGESLNFVPKLYELGKVVIDLGGDYRLDSKEEYSKWYGKTHTSAELLNKKIYGLADYNETNYKDAKFIANPGCYPTATSLGLLPIVSGFNDFINSISTSAYSGTSGAGKSPKPNLLLSEMDGNVTAYSVSGHRHQPEISQVLTKAGNTAPFSFTTHLLPVAVGIYATSIVHLNKEISESDIKEYYQNFYQDSEFVRLRDVPPQLNWVVNTNFCDINITVNDKVAIITSAIDNLIKGASGQAIQNMNKIYGWSESLGLKDLKVKNASIY